MFASTIAGMLAGFGLFFVGVWTLTENLKQLSGRRLRQAVLKNTRHPAQGFFWGCIAGAMAQSVAASVFILVGMISAGLLTMRAAIPMLAGANIGTSLLVFLSTIDLDLAVMFVLGVSGILMTQINREWLRPIMHGLFGLGLLFLGIGFIQSNAAPLVQTPWVQAFFTESSSSFIFVFLFGVIMCFIAQSMSAVTILAISLGVAGVLSVDLTILAIYGAQLGSGLVTYLLSMSLRGSMRQVAYLQIISTNVIGTTLFVGLWVVETYLDVPLVKAVLYMLADDIPTQMAFLYLILGIPIVCSIFVLTWVERKLADIAPPTRMEKDGQPQFVNVTDVSDIEAALAASQQEQNRLVTYLNVFFEIADGTHADHTTQSLSEAFDTLATELDYFLEDLGHQDLDSDQYERLNRIVYSQRVVRSLGEMAAECTVMLSHDEGSAGMARFVNLIRTSLETTVLTAQSAYVDGHARDLDRLAKMAGDRSEVLGEVRYAYLTRHAVQDRQERMRLVRMTVVAERIFWALDMLRKTLVVSVDKPVEQTRREAS